MGARRGLKQYVHFLDSQKKYGAAFQGAYIHYRATQWYIDGPNGIYPISRMYQVSCLATLTCVSSWEMKDRYAVGSYPTVIAARPDGTALDRIVGYPGEDAFLSWLVDATGVQPVDELLGERVKAMVNAYNVKLREASK